MGSSPRAGICSAADVLGSGKPGQAHTIALGSTWRRIREARGLLPPTMDAGVASPQAYIDAIRRFKEALGFPEQA